MLLVTVPDRLARRYAYQVLLVEEFTRGGCEVVFVQHGLGASPEEADAAPDARRVCRVRTGADSGTDAARRLFAARAKGELSWGNPPYGHTYVGRPRRLRSIWSSTSQAEVVRLLYRWCVEDQLSSTPSSGGSRPMGLSPARRHGGHRAVLSRSSGTHSTRGKPITIGPRRPMCTCRMAGAAVKIACGNGHGRTRRPSSEWIAVPVPPIIDPETWERGASATPTEPGTRPTSYDAPYLLRSLLVCGRCGRRMAGSWSALGGRYICALRYPRHVPGACLGRSLSAPAIEQSVWGHVQGLLADPDVLRQQYEQGRGDPAVNVRAEHERARLERKLMALEREKTRVLDAYQAEVIELTELAERRARLTEQGQQPRARVQEIEQQRQDRAAELRLLEGVESVLRQCSGRDGGSLFRGQAKVLQLVVQRIVVEDHRITIEHVVPSGPIRLQPEHPAA